MARKGQGIDARFGEKYNRLFARTCSLFILHLLCGLRYAILNKHGCRRFWSALKPSLEGWKLFHSPQHELGIENLETFLRGMETPADPDGTGYLYFP